MTGRPGSSLRRAWRSVEAAAIAGLVHSFGSLGASLLLFDFPDLDAGDATIEAFVSDATNQRQTAAALNLLAISSIAFLWFVAVIRRRLGTRANPFFGTVFIGSALLVTGCWLTAGVLLAAPTLTAQLQGVSVDAESAAMAVSSGLTLASVIATRLEAVFIVSTTTVGRLAGVLPRWLVATSYAVGLTLLVVPVPNQVLTYVFPVWVAVVSTTLLVKRADVESLTART